MRQCCGDFQRCSRLSKVAASRLPPTTQENVALVLATDVSLSNKQAANDNSHVIFNEIVSSLDRIIAKQASKSSDEAPPLHEDAHSTSILPHCAPREGLIISNTLGCLTNNLFEVGFANRLATELCWNEGEIPNPRGSRRMFSSCHAPCYERTTRPWRIYRVKYTLNSR